MNPNFDQIRAYFNIALVVAFILIVVVVVIAALRGFLRGVWKSTHNMVVILSLIVIAFITLDPLCKFVENFDLSIFITGTYRISQVVNGSEMVYYVPITSVKETGAEFIKGLYLMSNIGASSSSATNFAFAIVESALKILLFIIDMLLIVSLGNLFSFITWYAFAQHMVPRLAKRVIKIRWLGALETGVTYLILTILFFTPFTSILNSINQSYQKNKPNSDNEIVMNIGNFVDAYNDSLFAKVLFNWTVDKDGMTIDTKLFSTFTTGISEDVSVNIVNELGNITNLAVIAAQGLTTDENSQMAFDGMRLIYKDVVDSVFDVLGKSNLLSNILPMAAELALNSGVLDQYIPTNLMNLSDVEWKKEIGYVQDMVDSFFDSGLIDALITTDSNGKRSFRSFQGDDLFDFLDSVLYSENFTEILNVFKAMDDSKLLSRLIPTFIYMFETSEEGQMMKQYLPFSWEELNEFSWGFELYTLFDFLHQTITIDRDFLKAFLIQTGSYTPKEDEQYTNLATVISRSISKFSELLVGKIGSDGKLENVDKYGRTIVFQNGKRLPDKHYCLLDMKLFEMALPTVLRGLYKLDFMKEYASNVTETDEQNFTSAVDKLSQGTVLVNFKKEFNSIFGIIGTLGKDQDLVNVLFGADVTTLMEDPNNFFSIKSSTINVFKEAICKMEDSSLLYFGIVPVIKSLIGGEEVSNSFKDLGLRNDILVSAINQDMKKEEHNLFSNFASLLEHWSEFSRIFSAVNENKENVMNAFKDTALIKDLKSVLKAIITNPIINPVPEAGDTYEKNENLYSLLEYVFSMTGDNGLTITRDTLRKVETENHTWSDEIDALGNIFEYVASHDVLNAANVFNNGLSRTAINDLKDKDKIGLPQLFTYIDKSYIFKSSLGPFLDKMFGDTLSGFLIDTGNNISFSNISNWTQEGQNIANLLDSIYNLLPESDSDAKNFLSNLDLSKLHNIVEVNDMFHQLSNSGIFTYIDENNVQHYQFGKWFYGKVNDSMGAFTVDKNNYDLLADPVSTADDTWTWKDSWGIKPGEAVENPDPYFLEYKNIYNPEGTLTNTHMMAYRDFVYLNGIDDTDPSLRKEWCDYQTFTTEQDKFLNTGTHKADLTNPTGQYIAEESNYWGDYFGSDKFVTDYDNVFKCDEISRVCKFMTYSMRVLETAKKGEYKDKQIPFDVLPISLIDGLLTSINETSCLRICLYSFYRIAGENLLDGYSAFNLSSAYNIYLIDANCGIYDFAHARAARQAELDILIKFYDLINKAKDKGIINSSNNFDYSKLNKDGFLNEMKEAIKDLSDSYVFHRLGSAKVNSLTTFQGLFNSMLSESSIKDTIYLGDNSPKDKASTALYTSKEGKVDYLVKSTFLTDKQISDQSLKYETQINKQHAEIDNLLISVDSFYSLKDKDGNVVSDINAVDMKRNDNIDAIETLFNNLNNSNLLKDCLPNSIYKIFVENDQFSIESNGQKVDFKRVDPFYHYYYNDKVARSEPDFDAKYLAKDINSITSLLEDYQELDTQLAGKEMSNPAALKAITGEGGALKGILMDMHNSNLFHTPARHADYPVVSYYTNQFDNGYTLFEELVSKICSFVKLDDFAYDKAYDVQASASIKLYDRIKEVTKADDTGKSTNVYHKAKGLAWSQEIDSIMNLANTAADLGGGSSLDISSFELDKLEPIDIKNMLKAVNSSDIVCDALPKFIKDGFDSIKLGDLTTYNAKNYAYYRLGQVVYGGSDANAPEGTEIDNIYQVMLSLRKNDEDITEEDPSIYYTNMNNLNEFVKGAAGEDRLTGLLRFVYKSHILNTSLAGEYDKYNTLDSGHKISAQGVMLKNSLGDDLSSYIARDANVATATKSEADKIATLSKLIHMHNYFEGEEENKIDITYQIEAKGLKRLIDLTTDQITANTFSDNNVETIKAKKGLILNIVECAYNATNETDEVNYKRSAITSEFVSGLFNYILENQYTKLDTTKPTYKYILFSFGNDDASSLVLSDYDELDKVERDGLEGIIDSLSYIGTTSTPASMKANSEAIKDCFVKMGRTAGNNSHIAQALYLTEAHQYIKLIRNPLVLNNGEMFVPVDETSNKPTENNNIYSNSFSFKAYGEYIHTFLSGVVIP